MILKKIDTEELDTYLGTINYIAYSDSFARFARSAYQSVRLFVGVFENEALKAFFPIFEKREHQYIIEVPLFIYTELFFIDDGYVIDGMELGRELLKLCACDVVRMNIYKPHFPENFRTDGFEKIFTAMIIPLKGIQTFEEYLMHTISANARSKIYKGQHSGLGLTKPDLREFYDLYCHHVKFLGSRPHPIDYFQKIQDAFMFGVRHHGKLVAANLFTLNKNYLEVRFLADDIHERKFFPNNFLYAEMIRWAISRHVAYIDFGGIPNTMRGNIEFKKSFGAKEYPIYTKYFFRNFFQEIMFKIRRRLLYVKKYLVR